MQERLWVALEAEGYESYVEGNLLHYAEDIDSVDGEVLRACLADEATFDAVSAFNAEARERDVAVTPIVFVSERRIVLRQDTSFYETLRSEIEAELR